MGAGKIEKTEYVQRKGKDTSPEATVRKIKAILKREGIKVTEKMSRGDIEGTWFCRIEADGFGGLIGTNGKGTTKAFCRASGYAEFMERLQNAYFAIPMRSQELEAIIDDPANDKETLRCFSLAELREVDDGVTDRLICRIAKETGKDDFPAMFIAVGSLKKCMVDFGKNRIQAVRAWNYKKKEYNWISLNLTRAFCGSNGMASGNTLEEAIVQGASEIFERYVMTKVIKERLCLPDIPERVLKTMPIYPVIQRIREQEGYKVFVKDASLGGIFPVVCGIVTNEKLQKFGARFGASPSLDIALERVFTESMQGNTLERFSGMNWISYDEKEVDDPDNMVNQYCIGYGAYPSEFLNEEADFVWKPWSKVAKADNLRLSRMLLDRLAEHCGTLLVQDASCFGFPSVWIYAEGISDNYRFAAEKRLYFDRAANAVRHIGKADEKELEVIMKACTMYNRIITHRKVDFIYRFRPMTEQPRGGKLSLSVLACYCALKKNSKNAATFVKTISRVPSGEMSEDEAYANGLRFYLRAKTAGKEAEAIRIMEKTVDRKTMELLKNDLSQKDPLSYIYGECVSPECEQCRNRCLQLKVDDLYRKVYHAMIQQKKSSAEC